MEEEGKKSLCGVFLASSDLRASPEGADGKKMALGPCFSLVKVQGLSLHLL